MKLIVLTVLIFSSLAAFSQDTFKESGSFRCRSTAVIFPYERPSLLFSLRLEAVISTKEYDLSSAPDMSKAKIKMIYNIRKSNEVTSIDQGYFQGEVTSTTKPFAANNYNLAHYKVITSSTQDGYRELYLSLPIDFDFQRRFGMTVYLGEVNSRNTQDITLSCENLNYLR